MIGIDFMTYGMLLAAFRMATVGVVVYSLYAIASEYFSGNANLKRIKRMIFVGAGAILLGLLSSTAAAPKFVINTPINMELKNYDRNDEEIIINTPAARTKDLDGFTPLKNE